MIQPRMDANGCELGAINRKDRGGFILPPMRSLKPQRGNLKRAQGNALGPRPFRIES